MIYVFQGGSVVYDGSTITEGQKSKAVAVESLPTPEIPQGYYARIRANLETQEVYYEYLPNAREQELERLLEDAISLLEESEVI